MCAEIMKSAGSRTIPSGGEPVAASLEQQQTLLRRYCLSLTGSSWEADDLAQDTWLKLLRMPDRIAHNNPEALLLRIARNTWIDRSRRIAVLNRILHRTQSEAAMPEAGSGLFETESAFHALIKYLSPLQRAVFLLRDVFGYTAAEAAGKLAMTEGAVKAALHRARQALGAVREELERSGPASPEQESMRAFLQMLAAAYQSGDIDLLVQLVQRDELEPAMAVGVVQNRLLHKAPAAGHSAAGHSAVGHSAAGGSSAVLMAA